MDTAVTEIDTTLDRIDCASCCKPVLIKDALDLWLEVEAARDLCPICSHQLFS